MPTSDNSYFPLTLIVTDREDGGQRISCIELPSLHLSGLNRIRLWEQVTPAIKVLLLTSMKKRVLKLWLPEQEVAFAGPSPRCVFARAETNEYGEHRVELLCRVEPA